MNKLSVMVNTYNEERNIEECLKGLTWADELVVVDSGSTDSTVAIANKYAHQVITIEPGDFATIRNAGLEHLTGDWVLIVDADERVTTPLREEIEKHIQSQTGYTGFMVPRKNLFMGHWIRYGGWYPDYVLRLFRNNRQHRFVGKVHEKVSLSGNITKLKEPLVHYTYIGLEQYINKLNRYTTLSAQMMEEQGRRCTFFQLLIRPALEFLKIYFFKTGFRDGIYGFLIAYMSSTYIFVKFAKLWLLRQLKTRM